jgi:hypothetical protein
MNMGQITLDLASRLAEGRSRGGGALPLPRVGTWPPSRRVGAAQDSSEEAVLPASELGRARLASPEKKQEQCV